MRTGDTCQLVTDPALQAGAKDLLDQWEADRRAEGWSVFPRRVVTSLSSGMISTAGHVFLIGDAVPFVTTLGNPDGHYFRDIEADYKLVSGAVGRLWFANQPMTGRSSLELYRAYLTKRHNWAANAPQFGLKVCFLDYLLDPQFSGYEYWIQEARRQVGPALLEERYGNADGTDTNFAQWGKDSRLCAQVFSGGHGEYPPGGFYQVGGPDEWQAADPAIGIFGGFGSMQCQVRSLNSFLTNVLTGSHTVVSFYNQSGLLPIWHLFAGATAGEVGADLASNRITNVLGDPTVMFPPTVPTAYNILEAAKDMPQFQAQVAAVMANAPVPSTPTSPTPTTPVPVPSTSISLPFAPAPGALYPGVYGLGGDWRSEGVVYYCAANSAAENGAKACVDLTQDGAAINRRLTGLTPGKEVTVSFMAAFRPRYPGGSLRCSADGTTVNTVTSLPQAPTYSLQSFKFTPVADSAVIRFQATAPGQLFVADVKAG